jgi:hypothetical protein
MESIFRSGSWKALIISNCQDAGNCRRPRKEQRSQKNEGTKATIRPRAVDASFEESRCGAQQPRCAANDLYRPWRSGQIAKGCPATSGKASDGTGAARPATRYLSTKTPRTLTWMRTLVRFSLRMRCDSGPGRASPPPRRSYFVSRVGRPRGWPSRWSQTRCILPAVPDVQGQHSNLCLKSRNKLSVPRLPD